MSRVAAASGAAHEPAAVDAEPAAEVLVQGRGLARSYHGRVALEPTDLDVHAGEVIVLVGPNGAGKSTLLALLAGALPPSAGSASTRLPPAAIGWAPQRPALYRHLSARENLVLFARLHRLRHPAAEVERLLDDVGLASEGRPASQLSVGNQQRLNLALAFLGSPRVLLLDEPTASLDPAQARAVWRRVEEARLGAAGVVVATHVPAETTRADRVLVLSQGHVVFTGSAAEYAHQAAAM